MAHPAPLRLRVEDGLIKSLPENAPAWRRAALTRFAEKGLPHRRVESWRYTDLRDKLRDAPEPAPASPPDAQAIASARARIAEIAAPDALKCVFIDGFFVADLSDLAEAPAGLSIRALGEEAQDPADVLQYGDALGASDAIVLLNQALARGGVSIEVAAGARIARPIAFYSFLWRDGAAFSRSFVRLREDSCAHFIEIADVLPAKANSPRSAQSHDALLFALADRSHASLAARAGGQDARTQSLLIEMGAQAHFSATHVISDAHLTRRQVFARLSGEDGKLALRGLSLLAGRDHADATLFIDHAAPRCESREYFRHVLQDEAVAAFQGCISVRSEAQKTDGAMKSRALLLNDGVAMFNKPELEIFADDVVCGHGATVGALDEDQIFYLVSRGLSHDEAEALLIEAFANEILEDIEQEAERDWLLREARDWLHRRKRA